VRYSIGVDVGGTFTDIVSITEDGRFYFTKTPSTPGDESVGVIRGIGKVARHEELALEDLMRQTDLIIHGTTVATNTMVQLNGAKTGLITTKGFRDEIEIRRGIRESLFNIKLPPPPPIIPRHRRLGVSERVTAQGEVVVPLDEDAARAAIRELKAAGVEAIAVCFLFSFLRPDHEKRVLDLLAEEYPEAYACASSDVFPQIREFERVSTTVVNAYIGPKMKKYLNQLEEQLRTSEFKGELFVMQSNGGVTTLREATRRPVYALFSGPASGITASTFFGKWLDTPNLITVDMGGTSYDVCLIADGEPAMGQEHWVSRFRIGVPMIDVHSIGAGGGSIAWVDQGGALHVGPQSAGARPGPASYGLGGERPTVTDANLVLGFLGGGSFGGGDMQIHYDLAAQAIQRHIADVLKLSLPEAAYAMFRLVNSNMTNGIRVVSVQKGHDPRKFTLMAFGGAAAIHAGVQAAELGIPQVIIPKMAPVFCALGDLLADVRITELKTFLGDLNETTYKHMCEIYRELAERGASKLPRSTIVGKKILYYADLRYSGEVHEVTVGIPTDGDEPLSSGLERLIEDFHRKHEQLYAYRDTTNKIEALNLRVDAVGLRSKPSLGVASCLSGGVDRALRGERPVFFDGIKPTATPVYDGTKLGAEDRVTGPAIIEEEWTTIVVYPDQMILVEPQGNYLLHVRDRGSHAS